MTEQEREELIEKMANAIGGLSSWHRDTPEIVARAALAVAEPVIREEVEFELRVKNVYVHGTSHPEIYKTAEDDPREENARLREALKPFADMAHEFDDLFMGEEFWEDSDVLDCHQFDAVPTVGNFRAARAAIRGGGKDA
jgi:hypothetical protein